MPNHISRKQDKCSIEVSYLPGEIGEFGLVLDMGFSRRSRIWEKQLASSSMSPRFKSIHDFYYYIDCLPDFV